MSVNIYCEDALDFMRRQESKSASCILTDPPYCSGGALSAQTTKSPTEKYFKGKQKIHPDFIGDTMSERLYIPFMRCFFAEARRVLKDGVFLCFTDWRAWSTIYDIACIESIPPKGMGVWRKPGGRVRKNNFWGDTELIFYGTVGSPALPSPVYLPGVITESPKYRDREHQTQKPVALLAQLLKLAPPGLIIDPFAGSGSTLIAAAQLGRDAVGAEKSMHYYEVAKKRISAEI